MRWPEASLVALGQIPALAEETYRQGLNVLTGVLELLLAVHPSDQSDLEMRISALEREIQELMENDSQAELLDIRKKTLSMQREQLELLGRQDLRAEELLFRSNLSEAALLRTRVELAALTAGSSEIGVSAVVETLRNTIQQAKEVQEELRRLGY